MISNTTIHNVASVQITRSVYHIIGTDNHVMSIAVRDHSGDMITINVCSSNIPAVLTIQPETIHHD